MTDSHKRVQSSGLTFAIGYPLKIPVQSAPDRAPAVVVDLETSMEKDLFAEANST